MMAAVLLGSMSEEDFVVSLLIISSQMQPRCAAHGCNDLRGSLRCLPLIRSLNSPSSGHWMDLHPSSPAQLCGGAAHTGFLCRWCLLCCLMAVLSATTYLSAHGLPSMCHNSSC